MDSINAVTSQGRTMSGLHSRVICDTPHTTTIVTTIVLVMKWLPLRCSATCILTIVCRSASDRYQALESSSRSIPRAAPSDPLHGTPSHWRHSPKSRDHVHQSE